VTLLIYRWIKWNMGLKVERWVFLLCNALKKLH